MDVAYCQNPAGTVSIRLGPLADASYSAADCPTISDAVIVTINEPYPRDLNVTAAFVPRPVADVLSAYPAMAKRGPTRLPAGDFSYTFDYYSATASGAVAALEAAGWVDKSTKVVNVMFASAWG